MIKYLIILMIPAAGLSRYTPTVSRCAYPLKGDEWAGSIFSEFEYFWTFRCHLNPPKSALLFFFCNRLTLFNTRRYFTSWTLFLLLYLHPVCTRSPSVLPLIMIKALLFSLLPVNPTCGACHGCFYEMSRAALQSGLVNWTQHQNARF